MIKFTHEHFASALPAAQKIRDLGTGIKAYRGKLVVGMGIAVQPRLLRGDRLAKTATKAMLYAEAVRNRYVRLMVARRHLEATACEWCGAWYMDDKCWRRQLVRAWVWIKHLAGLEKLHDPSTRR